MKTSRKGGEEEKRGRAKLQTEPTGTSRVRSTSRPRGGAGKKKRTVPNEAPHLSPVRRHALRALPFLQLGSVDLSLLISEPLIGSSSFGIGLLPSLCDRRGHISEGYFAVRLSVLALRRRVGPFDGRPLLDAGGGATRSTFDE